MRAAARAGIALLLLLALPSASGCNKTQSWATSDPVTPTAFTESATWGWLTASPGPAPSVDVTQAATAMLTFHANRLHNVNVYGWPDSMISGLTTAAVPGHMGVSSILTVYSLPATLVAGGDPHLFEDLVPTGAYIAVATWDGDPFSLFFLVQDTRTGRWKYGEGWIGQNYFRETDALRVAAGGRPYQTRFVWVNGSLRWWAVRFTDGTERLYPWMSSGVFYVAGPDRSLQPIFYPSSILSQEMRYGGLP